MANHRPLLFLDTCDLLNLLQIVTTIPVSETQPSSACLPGLARPSHKREVRDSIHLEHCLELARRVRLNGFAEEIIFARPIRTTTDRR